MGSVAQFLEFFDIQSALYIDVISIRRTRRSVTCFGRLQGRECVQRVSQEIEKKKIK